MISSIGLTWLLLNIARIFVYIGENTYFFIYKSKRNVGRHLRATYHVISFIIKILIRRLTKVIKNIKSIPKKLLLLFFWSPVEVFWEIVKNYKSSLSDIFFDAKVLIRNVANFFYYFPKKSFIWFLAIPKNFLHLFKRFFTSLTKYLPRVTVRVKPAQKSPQKLITKKRRRYLKYITVLLIIVFFGLASHFSYEFYLDLPSPKEIGLVNYSLTSHVFDRNGKKLFDFYKDQNRTPVKISELPKYVYESTIAIEDKDFYKHNGIAPISGVARAFRDWIVRKQGVQGGSTITQQLVKTALLSPERTFTRKIKEMIIALETERIYTKNQILEMYLNQVPYGGAVYGIEEASEKYFGKNAKKLSLSEAALLAGLPQAPTDYSPFTNSKAAIDRRNQVLKAMLEQGYISYSQYVISSREKLNFSTNSIAIEAPHFVFYTRKYLEDYFDGEEMDKKGYRITTSLDLDVQSKVEEILADELEKIKYLNVSNGAVLVTKPATGEILAMVGSRDFFDGASGEFNVTTGLRQPGSSIKPILYALALKQGVTSASVLDDSPTVFRIGPTEIYKPVNYDGRFHGRVTVRYALANSYNIPAVKMMDKVGVINFINFAKEAGIDTWGDPSNYGLSLALGGGEVTMIDMAEGYSMLANYGVRTDLNPVLNIIGTDGKVYKQGDVEARQVIPSENAYIISDILSDNAARIPAFGTGSSLEIQGYKVAVKTGTTDEKRDNWTIGYTPDYMVVVWVGNNDHTPMNPYLTSGITGAAPIWNRVMTYLLKDYSRGQKNWFIKPDKIVEKTCLGRPEIFVSGTEGLTNCSYPTPIKTASGQ
ncbi:MAG: PBP1A family penicillin-binding protein [Patescibacteria group bacterium]